MLKINTDMHDIMNLVELLGGAHPCFSGYTNVLETFDVFCAVNRSRPSYKHAITLCEYLLGVYLNRKGKTVDHSKVVMFMFENSHLDMIDTLYRLEIDPFEFFDLVVNIKNIDVVKGYSWWRSVPPRKHLALKLELMACIKEFFNNDSTRYMGCGFAVECVFNDACLREVIGGELLSNLKNFENEHTEKMIKEVTAFLTCRGHRQRV